MKIPLTKQDVIDAREAGLEDLADRIQVVLDMAFWREVIDEVMGNDEATAFNQAEWTSG